MLLAIFNLYFQANFMSQKRILKEKISNFRKDYVAKKNEFQKFKNKKKKKFHFNLSIFFFIFFVRLIIIDLAERVTTIYE